MATGGALWKSLWKRKPGKGENRFDPIIYPDFGKRRSHFNPLRIFQLLPILGILGVRSEASTGSFWCRAICTALQQDVR
jgi:hypothetical protein